MSAWVLIYLAVYPAIVQEMGELDLGDSLQAFGRFEMATFEAYFASSILHYLVILAAIYAIIDGTGTLAGEEESGILELIVTLPLTRWQVVVSKAAAMAIAAFLILVIAALAAIVSLIIVQSQMATGIQAIDIVPPMLGVWPITMLFVMLSLFLSALLPQRRLAAALATLALVVSFLGGTLLPLAESLAPLAAFLPFHYLDRTAAVFTRGIQLRNVAVPTGAATIFLLLAILSFDRRDLTVGAWFWLRRQVRA